MRFRLIPCFAVLLAGASPALAQDAALPTDAYLDAGAREMVRLGRERRASVDLSIRHYAAEVQERISGGLRMLGWDRLFYRRESAARIDWTRDGPIRIEVLGAREVVPAVMREAQIPTDLGGYLPHLAFDPVENDVFFRFDSTFLRHPLAPRAEEHYRYRSGDTTTIQLPDGRRVRLFELVIIPRRDDIHLLSGSFWLEEETHAVVRAVFRPARAFDFDRDADEDDDDDVPGFLKPIRMELRYITIEYGLWEFRWWLPRLMAAEGMLQIAAVRMPLSYERRYDGYTVEGDTAAPLMPDSVRPPRCRPGMRMRIEVGERDSTEARRERAREDSIQAEIDRETPPDSAELERRRCRERFRVVVQDSASLLTSTYLPSSIYSDDVELLTPAELAQLREQLGQLPEAPWQLRAPRLAWGPGAAGMLRYNRVEALSIGARADFDFGRLRLDASARIGIADGEPNAEVSITRATVGAQRRLTAYRRLTAANPDTRPFGTGNSLNAFLFARDDGQYYRTLGVELELTPAEAASQWYGLRLYAERQRAAATETDFSLRHLLDNDIGFRPTIAAARADQLGAELALRFAKGFDPGAFRYGGELTVRGETGDFEFVRPGAMLRAALPVGAIQLSVETAAGTSWGTVPVQSEWFLGGPRTLRGYDGGLISGEAYWRTRTELSSGRPAARFSLFSDAGWTGPRDAFGTRGALVSAGVGASFLDGVIRVDLARALRRPTGWRFDAYISRSF